MICRSLVTLASRQLREENLAALKCRLIKLKYAYSYQSKHTGVGTSPAAPTGSIRAGGIVIDCRGVRFPVRNALRWVNNLAIIKRIWLPNSINPWVADLLFLKISRESSVSPGGFWEEHRASGQSTSLGALE